jgi:NADH/NAD ratio-sensing transcriptional regulator Rex
MEFDQKEETPFNIPEKKKTDKKTLAVYIGAGVITVSSLIFGYANYQATYFKDMEIKNLKTQLDDANTKLQRIDILENQVKELEASLVAKTTPKPPAIKKTKILSKKEYKKVVPFKKAAKKTKPSKAKEKKPIKKVS